MPEERFGITILTSGFIANAHERGLEAHVRTINETALLGPFIRIKKIRVNLRFISVIRVPRLDRPARNTDFRKAVVSQSGAVAGVIYPAYTLLRACQCINPQISQMNADYLVRNLWHAERV